MVGAMIAIGNDRPSFFVLAEDRQSSKSVSGTESSRQTTS